MLYEHARKLVYLFVFVKKLRVGVFMDKPYCVSWTKSKKSLSKLPAYEALLQDKVYLYY